MPSVGHSPFLHHSDYFDDVFKNRTHVYSVRSQQVSYYSMVILLSFLLRITVALY